MLLLATVAGASLAGCAGDVNRKKELIRNTPPPQPVLTDTAAFGGGILAVQCWLGPTVRLKKNPGKPADEEARGQGGLRQPEAGSDSAGDPFKHGASAFSLEEMNVMYGRENYEYVLPPRLALTLRITNAGTKPVSLTFVDVNSALGDFEPRPDTLTVAPGQQGSVDPMLSNLEVNFDELAVTVTIKIGGQKETRILKLHRTPE
jgi:hypothetical protein